MFCSPDDSSKISTKLQNGPTVAKIIWVVGWLQWFQTVKVSHHHQNTLSQMLMNISVICPYILLWRLGWENIFLEYVKHYLGTIKTIGTL